MCEMAPVPIIPTLIRITTILPDTGWRATPRVCGYNRDHVMKRQFVVLAALLAALPQFSCRHRPPANVAAEVNNHAIVYAELEKTYQSQFPQPVEGTNEAQVMSQKLE